MNINRKMLFSSLVLVSMLTTAFPISTYADVIKITFKQDRVVLKKSGKFKQPTIGGLRIDACVRGVGWSESDSKRCDNRRLRKIANEFCKSKGFNKSFNYTKVSHKGRHAVLTYKKSKPKHSFWKKQKGRMLIKNIVCK